jgi:hypothetical protein
MLNDALRPLPLFMMSLRLVYLNGYKAVQRKPSSSTVAGEERIKRTRISSSSFPPISASSNERFFFAPFVELGSSKTRDESETGEDSREDTSSTTFAF